MPGELDLERLTEELADEANALSFSSLYALSDLHGDALHGFGAALGSMPVERRRRLLRSMVDLGETSFEVNFDAVYRFCLDDEDDVVRAAAVDGLWEDESPSLVGPLLTMLRSDPSSLVRAATAGGLGRFVLAGEMEQLNPLVEMRIVDELLRTLHLEGESAEVRRRAIESMAYACTAEVSKALELAYYDQAEMVRLGAVAGMGRSCDRRWEPFLLEELASHSPAMRYQAALACGDMLMQRAVPALGHLLRDPDREVCHASIWALGQIGGEAARRPLLEAYETADEDIEVALDDALAEQAVAAGGLSAVFHGITEEDRDAWIEEEDDELPDEEESVDLLDDEEDDQVEDDSSDLTDWDL